MSRLDDDRKKIDEIDTEIVKLFEERFHVVEDVIAYKMENGMEILDSGRESVILEKNVGRIQDTAIKPYFEKVYLEMLKQSKEYQKEIQEKKKEEN